MNLNTLAALVRSDVTTVAVTFSPSNPRRYVFKVERSLAESLQEGMLVVAHCANGYKVVCVEEVHEEPHLDPEDGNEYHWVVQEVDTVKHTELTRGEEMIADRLRTQRQASYRRQALAAFGITDPDQFVKELVGPAAQEK